MHADHLERQVFMFPVVASALFLQNPVTQLKPFLPRSLPELSPFTLSLPVRSPCLSFTHMCLARPHMHFLLPCGTSYN